MRTFAHVRLKEQAPARVTADSGVTFDLRACRRTFGQENVNMGVPLDAVSRMMGHATTTTTEKY